MATPVIHLSGTVVVDGETEVCELWSVGGRLTFEKPARAADRRVDGVVLPGLVDVHCHIGLGAAGAAPPDVARAQAIADRDTGVLLVRDAGCPREPYSTRWLDDAPWAPRVIRCGQHIAIAKRYLRHLPREIVPDQLPDAVAEEALAGDGWVKLVGDWIDRALPEPDLALLWPDDKLTQAIGRAHALGARVTTHVFSAEGAAQALRCGVDCIEHGAGLDAAMMAQARAKGVRVVPTMIQRENFAEIAASAAGRFPRWERHLRRLHERRHEQAKALHDAGVSLLVGSDESTNIPHGVYCLETDLMARAGIPAEAIVAAASYDARRFLGVPGLEEGASADLVVYSTDPREAVAALHTPRAVVLRGALVAGALAGTGAWARP
ncbi:MAG: amidohydrolase family protein [Bifidobacteriaceae bacterium]|jgi:imidazolonepropionase-like amidohydrolase|nr:amidohydrolase family protein [Bifidobacteriaceae bacterium]